MDLNKRIEALIEPPLTAKGYFIVRIQLSGLTRRVLQIMIERQDDGIVTVDDCATVSRLVSVLLDQHDPIEGHYVLEVSSPGLDRPLVKFKDFERFKGCAAMVKTTLPIEGQKKFCGLIQEAVDNNVTLVLQEIKLGEPKQVVIPFTDIRSAKLEIDFNATKKKLED